MSAVSPSQWIPYACRGRYQHVDIALETSSGSKTGDSCDSSPFVYRLRPVQTGGSEEREHAARVGPNRHGANQGSLLVVPPKAPGPGLKLSSDTWSIHGPTAHREVLACRSAVAAVVGGSGTWPATRGSGAATMTGAKRQCRTGGGSCASAGRHTMPSVVQSEHHCMG